MNSLRSPPIRPMTWTTVRNYMERRCGVVLNQDQDYLLEPRLREVADRRGFRDLNDFLTAACSMHGDLALDMIDALTTHETSFFRDRGFWALLTEKVLPALPTTGLVRVWSAACSKGQEVYSLQMLLDERFPDLAARVRITATDVSRGVLAEAELGRYTELEVSRGLSPAQIERYFVRTSDGQFEARPALRRQISWTEHNLLAPRPAVVGCNLILCRNVLIYMRDNQRRDVLQRLAGAIVPKGFLGLGTTEIARYEALGSGLYRV